MVKHVVMWVFKPEAEGKTKEENIKFVESRLLKLPELIDSIETFEVGLNFSESDAAYDMVLISTHKTRTMLDDYRQHPQHKGIADYLSGVTEKRVVIDFEV